MQNWLCIQRHIEVIAVMDSGLGLRAAPE